MLGGMLGLAMTLAFVFANVAMAGDAGNGK